MPKQYRYAREEFEIRMTQGTRPYIYPVKRLAGGGYVSVFTEMAWKEFLAGWLAANGRDD